MIFSLSRYAFSICAAAVMLAACGGSQPPIGAPGAVPQSAAIATQAERSGSSMSPQMKSTDLLYAVTARGVDMLTYPAGSKVGSIKSDVGLFLCSDPATGNVFVTSNSLIFEYVHGGTKPIATLTAPSSSYNFMGCSVDPMTGNLAVANEATPTTVAIYHHGRGMPVSYSDLNAFSFGFCGYDNQGNLFINGVPKGGSLLLDELKKGGSSLENITLNKSIPFAPLGPVQWDGTYITIEDPRPPKIYRIQVSGLSGTIVGTTELRNQTKTKNVPYALTWIQGDTVIAAAGKGNRLLGYWNYPTAGKPFKVLRHLVTGRHNGFGDLTVSIGPSDR